MAMQNSTPTNWIHWISREANKLCKELKQAIDHDVNETLSEFRPIPEDEEPEEMEQQNLMGFKTPQIVERRRETGEHWEEGNNPQKESHKQHPQLEPVDGDNTSVSMNKVVGDTASNEQRMEDTGGPIVPGMVRKGNKEMNNKDWEAVDRQTEKYTVNTMERDQFC